MGAVCRAGNPRRVVRGLLHKAFLMSYKPRIWDLTVNTTHKLEGPMKDWPANIQDALYKHVERMGLELGEKLYIEVSRTGELPESGPFIHLRVKNVPPNSVILTPQHILGKPH